MKRLSTLDIKLPHTFARIRFRNAKAPDIIEVYDSSPESENFYTEFYKSAASSLKRVRQLQVAEIVKYILNASKGKAEVLDIGCGNGIAISEMLKEGLDKIEPWGIDPHTNSSGERIHAIPLKDLAQAPLPQKYNYLLMLDVFEHFEDPIATLALCRDHLKSNGSLILKVPNKNSLLYRLSRLSRWVSPPISAKLLARLYQVEFPPPHYYYYNLASLRTLCEQNGYSVEHHFYQSEIPWSGIWERLWGVSASKKMLLFAGISFLRLFMFGQLHDCLVVVVKGTCGAKK